MKRKIIIVYDDDELSAVEALGLTGRIAEKGYKSRSAGIPHWSWCSSWKRVSLFDNKIINLVACTKIKRDSLSADSVEFIREEDKTK